MPFRRVIEEAPPLFRRVEEPVIEPSTIGDIAKSTGAGLVRGAAGLAGLKGDVEEIIGGGLDWLGRKVGLPEPPPIRPPSGAIETALEKVHKFLSPTSADVTSAIEGAIGPLHEPETTAGEYARTIGEFVPGALAGPGGLARKALTQTVLPALASETAGQVTEGTRLEPYARMVGAILGSAAPSAGMRAVTPFPVAPGRRAALQTLEREGVTATTAGQKTGNRKLRYIESEIGGNKIDEVLEKQAEQFTQAALRRIGVNETHATPDVIDRAFNQIGQRFDDLASRNLLIADNQLLTDLGKAEADYKMLVPPSQRAPAVDKLINDILDISSRGPIPGRVYQTYRSRLDKMARSAKADPQLSEALFSMRNSLDDGMERTMQRLGNQADVAEWSDARRQYRDILVIEKALGGGGEQAGAGLITPARLRMAALGQNRRNFVRGKSNFTDLAQAGQSVMTPLPQSGTAPRAAVRAIPAMIGATAGSIAGGPAGGGLGALGGVLAPALMGRAVMSPAVQRYLSNQALGPTVQARNALTPSQRAALAILLAGGPRMMAPQP